MRVRVRLPDATRPGFEVPNASRGDALKALADTLMAANVDAPRITRILRDAAPADGPEFARFEAMAAELAPKGKGKATPKPSRNDPTFAQLATRWTSGELAREYPDHVKQKASAIDDERRCATLNKTIGSVPIRAFTIDHADSAMRALPEGLTSATRRQYAQALSKVLRLAAYPLRLIPASPLPSGWLPKVKSNLAKSYLYPAEDARLMASAVPLERRLLWGFLAREGMRISEALSLQWRDLDLERGAVRIDENKTDDPRAWALDPGVVRALAKVKGNAPDSAHAFQLDKRGQAAEQFRADLTAAGIDRAELFETTAKRMPIRVHDLRGTFVTLALASGKTETWVADRTGHRSSIMINRYRRAARSAAELGLGWLAPLDQALGLESGPRGGPNSGGSEKRSVKKRNDSKSVAPAGVEPALPKKTDFKSVASAIPPRGQRGSSDTEERAGALVAIWGALRLVSRARGSTSPSRRASAPW